MYLADFIKKDWIERATVNLSFKTHVTVSLSELLTASEVKLKEYVLTNINCYHYCRICELPYTYLKRAAFYLK